MNSPAQHRLDELSNEVARRHLAGTTTKAFMDRVEAEAAELNTQIATHKAALGWAGSADPNPYGGPPAGYTGNTMPTLKAVGGLGKSAPKWQPPSPLQASHDELKQLFDAAQHRAGGFQIEMKAVGADNGGIRTKAAITETGGGFTLPSVIVPGLQQLLPYEPDRLFSHFPGQTMAGPSASFLQHVSNTNPAAAVGEAQPKPDLGMVLAEQTVKPVKIAALATVSMEALQDYEEFQNWIPLEASRALINAETAEIVSGSGTAPHLTGILNTSGLLTRAMGTDTPIDAIQLAFNDLRVGPAFGTADLVALHPTTWNAIRRQKTTFDSYILSPDPSTGQVESIFGVPVVVNTFIPAGTGIVFDTSQAVLAWTRLGLTMGVNQFGDTEWTNNLVSFRVEERIAIGVRRPSAVVTVTGLPTS
jgi:HK97 family phage major capsid protein